MDTWKAEPCRKHEWERRFRAAEDDEDLTAGTVSVAMVMATYANGDGTRARPSIELLMKGSRLSERRVQAHLSWLRRHGWLILVTSGSSGRGRTARTAVYRLSFPATVTE